MGETVRRIMVRAFGRPERITIETVAEPSRIGPRQLLVDVEASGINDLDVYGRGTFKVPLPDAPGNEGVGTAVQIGSASGPPPANGPKPLIEKCSRCDSGSVFAYTADPAKLRRRAGR